MKMQYQNPEIEVLLFDTSDVILTDSTNNGDIEYGYDQL